MPKPWPADAVMIVAAHKGQERRERMEAVVPAKCRDCGCELLADSRCIRTAEALDSRRGRPVDFFCIECCLTYARETITELHDLR